MECPLGLCDGSGFVKLPIGAPGDGREVEDEDNCVHVDWNDEEWTPEKVAAFLACYRLAHRSGDSRCPWCGPAGVHPGERA